MEYKDILLMIKNACDRTFYKGTNYDGIHKVIVECATQIYIEQVKAGDLDG